MKKLKTSLAILTLSKIVDGKICKFYPSYPDYGDIYSVDCFLDCCKTKFPTTAQTACCDRSLSWIWIV
ncbi:unnamed protein product [Brachionus calyciflorus]|uniref:Uncharacterized protein n=1 Tax=Brachionus calyciflorus TaxID=104777 RepID=A0A814QS27_9BILA|nr:unnamed protein product [Brachionus calyciflorus]